jgi:LmbE family N-acetylglucosaminyl deacetylase
MSSCDALGMANEKGRLEQLQLQPWRVLVVAAHPGDIEYTASAAVARWTSEGAEVVYLIATRGENSMPGVEPEQASLIRSAEQSASAAAVGVRIVDFLDLDDGAVVDDLKLRRGIVTAIRQFGPDVVLVINHRELGPDGTHNHADHRAVGLAALDAISAAANQWRYRDIGAAHRVDVVLVAGSPLSAFAIDVSGFEDAAVAALAAQQQHLNAIAPHPMTDPEVLRMTLKASAADLAGPDYAVPVERIDFGPGEPCQPLTTKQAESTETPLKVMKLPKRPKAAAVGTVRSRNVETRPARKTRAKQETSSEIEFKARLEQNGKLTGIEIPERVIERLNGGKRPKVSVIINSLTFEASISSTKDRSFLNLNADRRKKAAVELNDTFFVTIALSKGEPTPATES